MSIFTALLCVLPILIVSLPFIGALQTLIARIMRRAEKKSAERIKLELLTARIQDSLRKADLAAKVLEAKIAQDNNKAVLQDLNIELLTLKIKKQRYDLGLDAPEFTPKDYDQ